MNIVLATLLLMGLLSSGAAAGERALPGKYVQADAVTQKALPVGSQLIIIAGKGGKLGFSINAIRALDSNQGFVAGTLTGQLPITWTQTSSTVGNCRLRFQTVPEITHALAVVQDAGFGDCGFGAGVTANGTYVLVPEKQLNM